MGDECVYLMKLLRALLSAWFDSRGAVNLLSVLFVFSFFSLFIFVHVLNVFRKLSFSCFCCCFCCCCFGGRVYTVHCALDLATDIAP